MERRGVMCVMSVAAMLAPRAVAGGDELDKTTSKRTPDEIVKEHKARPDTAPALGAAAPTFTLPTLAEGEEIDLARFRGTKPVVLVFGSYT
jgi:hypothetical protein